MDGLEAISHAQINCLFIELQSCPYVWQYKAKFVASMGSITCTCL